MRLGGHDPFPPVELGPEAHPPHPHRPPGPHRPGRPPPPDRRSQPPPPRALRVGHVRRNAGAGAGNGVAGHSRKHGGQLRRHGPAPPPRSAHPAADRRGGRVWGGRRYATRERVVHGRGRRRTRRPGAAGSRCGSSRDWLARCVCCVGRQPQPWASYGRLRVACVCQIQGKGQIWCVGDGNAQAAG